MVMETWHGARGDVGLRIFHCLRVSAPNVLVGLGDILSVSTTHERILFSPRLTPPSDSPLGPPLSSSPTFKIYHERETPTPTPTPFYLIIIHYLTTFSLPNTGILAKKSAWFLDRPFCFWCFLSYSLSI